MEEKDYPRVFILELENGKFVVQKQIFPYPKEEEYHPVKELAKYLIRIPKGKPKPTNSSHYWKLEHVEFPIYIQECYFDSFDHAQSAFLDWKHEFLDFNTKNLSSIKKALID